MSCVGCKTNAPVSSRVQIPLTDGSYLMLNKEQYDNWVKNVTNRERPVIHELPSKRRKKRRK